jgi:hypothetical protein
VNWVGVPRRGRPGFQPAYLDSPPSLGAAVKTPRVRGGSPIRGQASGAEGEVSPHRFRREEMKVTWQEKGEC